MAMGGHTKYYRNPHRRWNDHVFVQDTAPTIAQGAELGTVWVDTDNDPPIIKVCVDLSPLTFESGGSGEGAPTPHGNAHHDPNFATTAELAAHELEPHGGGGGGAESFTDLDDVPADYTGHGGKAVAVTSGATGLEFVDFPAGGGGASDYPQIAPRSNRWVLPGYFGRGTMTFGLPVGWFIGVPIFVTKTTQYEAIGIDVTTADSGEIRLGVYEFDGGNPGALLLDAGTVDCSTTGSKSIALSPTLTLERGYYILAYVSDANPSVRAMDRSQVSVTPVDGYATALSNALDRAQWVVSGRDADVAGGLPDPGPALTGTDDLRITAPRLQEVS